MSLKNSLIVLWVYIMYVLGMWIFLSGYLLKRIVIHRNNTYPLSVDSQLNCFDISSLQNIPHTFPSENSLEIFSSTHKYLKKFDKAIILIIDALRYDFVRKSSLNEYYTNKMPVFEESAKYHRGRALLLRSLADPPTTTLQRLKGITTGSLPTFIDASWNFAGSEIDEDNLIWRLTENKKRVVFLGDDTWESLFPRQFYKSYAYPSFNVKDLDTVDDGILSHLYGEITRNESDVIIAHFLGVDHCGHRYGPNHPEMSQKLSQMNNVVVKLIENLKNDTLLIVLGDHGMTESGDHGGDSYEELSTTLFMYSKDTFISDIPMNEQVTVSQVDIVPTLSLLLGMPIPFSNLGHVISHAFHIECFGNELDSVVGKVLAIMSNVEQVRQYLFAYTKVSEDLTSSFVDVSEDILGNVTNLWSFLKKEKNMKDNKKVLYDIYEGYKKYLVYVRETCQDKWATFNMENMIFGSSILVFTIFCNFWIAVRLDFKHYIVILSGIIIFSFFLTLYFFNLFLFILWLFTVIAVSFISMHFKGIYENTCFSWSTLVNVPVFFTCIIFFSSFSNSFVIYEDQVTLFLVQSLIIYRFFPVITNFFSISYLYNGSKITKPLKRNQKTSWQSILIPVCLLCLIGTITFGSLFRKCREEQLFCESTDLIISLEKVFRDHSYKAARLLLSLISIVLPVATYLGLISKKLMIKGQSVPAVCVKYAFFFTAVLISLRWWLSIVSSSVVEKILKGNEVFLPRAAFIISCGICLFMFIFPILSERPWEMRSKDVYGGSCFSFMFAGLQLLYLVCGDALSPANMLMSFSALFYIILLHSLVLNGSNIMDSLNTPEGETWTDVIIWSLLPRHWFYSTAHQATFSSIHWDAAFLLNNREVHSYILSGALVVINTFSSYIFFGLALPLVLIWSGSAFTSKALLRLQMKYLFCFGIKLFSTVLASFILRRHLMVWKIFTPKLIYEIIAIIITMLSSYMSYFFMLRASFQYHKTIRKNLSHMFTSKDQ